MLKKILIVEDIDSINTGIVTILRDKFSFEIRQTNSCDKALIKIKKSIQIYEPFDLIISDLSFKTDGLLTPQLKNGVELLKEAKKILPTLKTIVYTIEDKPLLIKSLIEDLEVDGFVLKGLSSLSELCKAIDKISKGEKYFTNEVLQIVKNNSSITFEEYDVALLELLAKGLTQEEISNVLKINGITPSSVSAIEKRINRMRTTLRARNNIQMVAIAKELSLI